MSKGVAVLAGTVATVVVVSIGLGLATPDGSVGDSSKPKATGTVASRTPTPTPTKATSKPKSKPVAPNADLAPASVRGVWPGRPRATSLEHGKVNWCPAVQVSGAEAANNVFGVKTTKAGACAAVRFVFEQRYSRLAIPRKSYTSADFDVVRSALTSTTAANTYQPRIDTFVANPASTAARGALGIVLFSGAGTPAGAKHASAGPNRVFYGKAFTTKGYSHRAAWVEPSWSTVALSVDRARSAPRLVARLTASASMPVFNTSTRKDDMMTVPTIATLTLARSGSTWKVDTWTITSHSPSFAPLSVK